MQVYILRSVEDTFDCIVFLSKQKACTLLFIDFLHFNLCLFVVCMLEVIKSTWDRSIDSELKHHEFTFHSLHISLCNFNQTLAPEGVVLTYLQTTYKSKMPHLHL